VILYNLRCEGDHEFEGWFARSAAFDEQAKTEKLVCPYCGSHKVEKAIMAPSVSGTRKTSLSAEDAGKLRQYMSGVRKYVQENADYVGKDFPEEARKIHYGETEERHIYGEATTEEVKDMVKEGIDIAPLPPDLDGTN
jgi:hypothetical protein